MASASAQALHTSLSQLQVAQNTKKPPKIKKTAPADSWEDEADNFSSSSDGNDTETESTPIASPAPPPPTPSSPSQASLHDDPMPTSSSSSTTKSAKKSAYRTAPPFGLDAYPSASASASGSSSSEDDTPPTLRPNAASGGGRNAGTEKRPEKSTAVASRLIAAGIGQKAPKRTQEQREYDAAMKAQERKRREVAREEEERRKVEREKAIKDVWGD